MREQVWFIISRTNERRYATTRPPAGEWEEKLRQEGYSVFRIEFEMPDGWDKNTDAVLEGLDLNTTARLDQLAEKLQR